MPLALCGVLGRADVDHALRHQAARRLAREVARRAVRRSVLQQYGPCRLAVTTWPLRGRYERHKAGEGARRRSVLQPINTEHGSLLVGRSLVGRSVVLVSRLMLISRSFGLAGVSHQAREAAAVSCSHMGLCYIRSVESEAGVVSGGA